MEKKKFFWQKKKEYYQFPLGLRILGGVWSVVWTAVKVALGAGLVALAVVCITGGIFACLMGNYLQEDVIPNAGFNVEDFAGQEFLMPSLGFHLDILRALNRSNVTPVIRTTQVSDSVIISMVEHGLGVSVLSELVLKGRRDDVQAVPLDPPAYRQLGILVRDRKDLRPAARRFITEAREIIDQIK